MSLAVFLVALSAVLYGFCGFLGMELLQTLNTVPCMLFWRFFIAGIAAGLFCYLDRSSLPVRQLSRPVLIFTCFTAALGYALSSFTFFVASERIGTGLAVTILFSNPVLLVLFAWLIKKEEKSFLIGVTMLAIMVGLYLLEDPHGSQELSMLGLAAALLSAVFYAMYLAVSEYFSKLNEVQPLRLTSIICFGAAAMFLVPTIATHSFVSPPSLGCWGYLLIFSVFVTALPIQLMLLGLKYMSPVRASVISILEPLVTVVVGSLLLHEVASPVQRWGVAIILVGSLIVQLQKKL